MAVLKQKVVHYPNSTDDYEPYDVGAVRFDEGQNLSEGQKRLAKSNIGVIEDLDKKLNRPQLPLINGKYVLTATIIDGILQCHGNIVLKEK